MHDRSPTNLLAATTASVLLVVAIVVAWASPAAAVLPTFTGPTTVAVTTNATVTLTGTGAPQVVDPDTTTPMSLQLTIGGLAIGQPTFTLDGTSGLGVSGSTVRSGSVTIAGTKTAINAALDGMQIHGGPPTIDYTLTLIADETPGSSGGTRTRVITIHQAGTSPVNLMPAVFSVGTRAARELRGAATLQVSDADSLFKLELELNLGAQSGSASVPVAERPTFSLNGFTGLTLNGGSLADSRFVSVNGTLANLNRALDGMVFKGGITAGAFRIVMETDDVVGPTTGDGDLADTDFTNFTVSDDQPVNGGVGAASMGTSSTRVLAPITVSDSDSPRLDVELKVNRRGVDLTSTRPTFTLPTTAGLNVTGAPSSSVSVRLVGPVAALNAALAGVRIDGPPSPGLYDLVIATDDGPDGEAAGENVDTDTAIISVLSVPPTASAGPDLSIGTSATRQLTGASAPSVGDPDDDRVEATIEVQRTGSDTTSVRPTFAFATTGLSVTSGSANASSVVTVTGPPATIDDALDDMFLTGGSSGGYRLVVTVDELVGAGVGNIDTDLANITVTALAPILTMSTSLTLGASTTLALTGANAPTITDADSPVVDVNVQLIAGGGSNGVDSRFSLDGTAGLTITAGAATSSDRVTVTGSLDAVGAALDGLILTAAPTAEDFSIVVFVDDAPGTGTGQTTTRSTSVTVVPAPPGSTAGTPLTLASHTSSPSLVGAAAPQVSDPDSPVVDVRILTTHASVPAEQQPTFTLDGTADLTVVAGTAVASHMVLLRGPPSAVNAALEGMVVRGGSTAGTFSLVVGVDDVPGDGGNQVTSSTAVTVTDAVPTVAVPGSAPHAHPGQTRDVPVTATDTDSPLLEARVRVLGTTVGRPKVRVTAPAGLVIDAGPATGTEDLQIHGTKADVISALGSLRAVAGTATGSFTVEVVVDDARPEVGNTVTRTFTVAVDPPPSAPTAVGAQARVGGITVAWSPPATPGPNPLTGYRVSVVQGSTLIATADVGPSVRTRAFDGLANGTPVTVQVRALTALGPGVTVIAGPVTPQVFLPFGSAGAMVDRLFLDLVGRAPTAAERSAAVAGLGNGSLTPAGLVAQLRGSGDNTGNVDPVTRLYRAYFLRIPDAGGLDFWIGRRRSGQSLNQISQSFALSPEFAALYGSLSNEEFVELVYENVLGRPGEAGGVVFWTGQLDNGARSRGQVMTGFSESPEYKGLQRAEVDVSVAYIALLGRRPTNAEHTSAVAGLEGATLTLAALHASILTSTEYHDLIT